MKDLRLSSVAVPIAALALGASAAATGQTIGQ